MRQEASLLELPEIGIALRICAAEESAETAAEDRWAEYAGGRADQEAEQA